MRHLSALTVVLMLVVAVPATGQGQGTAVEIRFKVAQGEALFYQVTGAVGTKQTSGRLAIRVLEVGSDGLALVEMVLEDPHSAGTPQSDIDDPWLFRVRPDGAVAERLVGAGTVTEFPFPLPAGPVKVGDSWTRNRTATESGVRYTYSETATLERIDSSGESRTATIRYRTNARGTSRTSSPAGTTVDVRITLVGNETIVWSLDRHRILQSASESTLTTQMFMFVGDQTIPLTSTVKGTVERRLVDPAEVTAAPVSAEVLIAPGRGIGASLLEQTPEAISATLGAPAADDRTVFAAKPVRWGNDLVGLIDADDPTRLVGLLMADRKCRTDKGIGFGSSEAAVLFAYGMEPARRTLSIPRVGDLKVLIYDDQGVAFLVMAQRVADAPRTVPPVRTVYATVVYLPNGAAKVFPAP